MLYLSNSDIYLDTADHKQCSGNHHEKGKYLPVEIVPLAVRFACQNIGLGS